MLTLAPRVSAPLQPAVAADAAAAGSVPERLIVGYLYAFPLLWALGLTMPGILLILAGSVLLCVRSRRAVALALPWALVGLAQATSTVFNWAAAEMGWAALLRRLLGSYVLGWFAIAACVAIGASGLVRQEALLRALRRFALYFVLLGVPTLVAAWALGLPVLHVPGPIGMLLPADLPARRISFSMYFFSQEYFMGTDLPRLAIFFPWATALGFGGVALACIGWAAPPRYRGMLIGIGVFMTLSSLSRLAIVNLVVCLLALWYLERSRLPRMVLAQAGLLAILAAAFLSGFSTEPIEELRRGFHDVRPGASYVREAVYTANWDGFHRSPVIGQGWPGESLFGPSHGSGEGVMVAGSHSSFSGLLYKGGALTFAAFVVAFLATAVAVLRRLDGTRTAPAAAAGILLAIAVSSGAEGVEAFAVPTFWAFLMVGIALAPDSGIVRGRGTNGDRA
jgi:hypothetical protein